MELNSSSWSDFKHTCITVKNLNLQFCDMGSSVVVVGPDANGINFSIDIPKLLSDGVNTTTNPDYTDFVTNIQPQCNFAIGTRNYAFTSPDFVFNATGIIATAAAGTATNIDFKIPGALGTFQYLNGAYAMTNGGVFGDYVNVYVIDKDNVLGYGANTVLSSYISYWYMNPSGPLDITTPYAAKPPAGVYIRVVYNSTGASPVSVAVNYRLHTPI